MREIITNTDELYQRSEEINITKEGKLLQATILEMKELMREKNLLSLSAIQIGVPKRIICMKFDKEDIRTFVNPMIVAGKGLVLHRLSCSSIPGKSYLFPYNSSVTVMYMTPIGKMEQKEFIGLAAVKIQHLLHHLEGILLSDVGLELDDDFDAASEGEKDELISAYLDSLDIKRKTLDKEIKENDSLQKLDDAISFLVSVQKGETKLDPKSNDLNDERNSK